MSVALITRTSETVDHLGLWTYHEGSTWEGRYAPLCGLLTPNRWHVTEWPDGRGDGVKRKPLCEVCARHLDQLHELAGRRGHPPSVGHRPRSGQAGTATLPRDAVSP